MADYRELLRRAIEASPENTGAARRQVYEKARTALVAQLRAINPPLAAREITQHRLQLEDCIREVEQQATEVLLGSLKSQENVETADVTPEEEPISDSVSPADAMADSGVKQDEIPVEESADTPVELALDVDQQEAVPADDHNGAKDTKSDISSEIETEAEVSTTSDIQDELQALISEAEVEASALEANSAGQENGVSPDLSTGDDQFRYDDKDTSSGGLSAGGLSSHQQSASHIDLSPKSGSIEYIIAQAQAAAERAAIPTRWKNDALESNMVGSAVLEEERPEVVAPVEVAEETAPPINGAEVEADAGTAMSSVREVEVEAPPAEPVKKRGPNDPQVAIDRAIETLDREARGEDTAENGDGSGELGGSDAAEAILRESSLDADGEQGGNALTTFLILFIILLAGVGGAGYWAWREGYIDLDTMFGQANAVEEALVPESLEPVSDAIAVATETGDPITGPGNTTATPEAVATASEELGKSEERLSTEVSPVELALVEETVVEPVVTPAEEVTSEPVIATEPAVVPDATQDRLPSEDRLTPDAPVSLSDDSVDVAANLGSTETAIAPIGSQSLLLEASSEGTTGAVPFSGTVDWSRGSDELGQPTLLAKANIPARNLGVNLLVRRNSDPSLPASHLMEINFDASETFVGGSIAGLPGVLLKNEELVQGTPLVGASARVVGNSFLFALSATKQDLASNTELLKSRKWMDLALVYATGKRAIITLEKDVTAQAMFDEVLAIWAEADAAASAEAASATQ